MASFSSKGIVNVINWLSKKTSPSKLGFIIYLFSFYFELKINPY